MNDDENSNELRRAHPELLTEAECWRRMPGVMSYEGWTELDSEQRKGPTGEHDNMAADYKSQA